MLYGITNRTMDKKEYKRDLISKIILAGDIKIKFENDEEKKKELIKLYRVKKFVEKIEIDLNKLPKKQIENLLSFDFEEFLSTCKRRETLSKKDIIKELTNNSRDDIQLLFPMARSYGPVFMYKFCLLVKKHQADNYDDLVLYMKWDFINLEAEKIKKVVSEEYYNKILNDANWKKPNVIIRKFLELKYGRNHERH